MFRLRSFSALAGLLLLSSPTLADSSEYQVPSAQLVALVDAPLAPALQLSPDHQTLALFERPPLASIEELARPELRLAGVRLDPASNGPSRARSYRGLTLTSLDGVDRVVTGFPEHPKLRSPSWSPDSRFLALLLDRPERVEIWLVESATAKARRLIDAGVNDAAPGASFQWVEGSNSLVVRVIPKDRNPAPTEPTVPEGPVIRQSGGDAAPARTYQDMLASPHDESLFDHFFTGRLVRVGIDGSDQQIAVPAVFTAFSPSPDGRFLLTETRHQPYSYLVPWYRFPNRVEVWDLDSGDRVQQIDDRPLHENIPISFGSVETGPRRWKWRTDTPATLVWVEAQDAGDARKEATVRDRLLSLEAPFQGEPQTLVDLALRFRGVWWGDGETAVVEEQEWKTRRRRGYRIQPDRADTQSHLLYDFSYQDRYNHPGSPLTHTNAGGHSQLLLDDGALLLSGAGGSPDGDRPFLRRLDLATGETTELFRSAAPYYERPIAPLDSEQQLLLVERQSKTEPPNYFVRSLADGTLRPVTEFPHPYPELASIHKETLEYERADGIPLSANLYLPAGYDPATDGPLPTLLWAYPREYKSSTDAGQRRDSPFQFLRVSYWGAVPFVTQGYAVLDSTAMPIVGEGETEPNDSFIEQLRSSASAAIQAGQQHGAVDPQRVAIGGHSYGAFMTANLLAHSDLFRAGIARSGAYNRTLTPFGFQSEERTYWQAPEIYYAMSPFMHADKVNEPILLIHGQADNNSGTFTLQSERLYSALKGHGATARLALLPLESHGYRSRESILHMLWEEERWLEEHVRPELSGGDESPGNP